jgi:hypothetical protein
LLERRLLSSANVTTCSLVDFYQDISVGIATGHGLEGQGTGLRFPPEARDCSFILRVQTGSEAHLGSYLVRTKGFSSRGKEAGALFNHSPPFTAEVKKAWSYTSTPP